MVQNSLIRVFSSVANQIHSVVLQLQDQQALQKELHVVALVTHLVKIVTMPDLQLAQLIPLFLALQRLKLVSTTIISKLGKLLPKMAQVLPTATLLTNRLAEQQLLRTQITQEVQPQLPSLEVVAPQPPPPLVKLQHQ